MSKPTRDEILKAVGILIRQARIESGRMQKDLAEATGLSRTSITNLEKGRQDMPISKLYKIARILDVDIIQLLPIDYIETPNKVDIEVSYE